METVFILFWKQVDAVLCDIGEVMYLQKNFVYNYFRVKERIFDSRGNVVHILVEKVKIEDGIRLKGHNW